MVSSPELTLQRLREDAARRANEPLSPEQSLQRLREDLARRSSEPSGSVSSSVGTVRPANVDEFIRAQRQPAPAPAGNFCPHCGCQRAMGAAFCSQCGAKFEPIQRSRPLWLVAALTVLTGGVYYHVWLGLSWADIKRELDDDSMHPFWHVLSTLVPIYGLFRLHAHYRTVKALLQRSASTVTIRASYAAGAAMAAGWLFGTHEKAPPGIDLLAYGLYLAVLAGLSVYGQWGLNACWSSVPGRAVRKGIHWAEWLTLALGVLFTLLFLIGSVGSLLPASLDCTDVGCAPV